MDILTTQLSALVTTLLAKVADLEAAYEGIRADTDLDREELARLRMVTVEQRQEIDHHIGEKSHLQEQNGRYHAAFHQQEKAKLMTDPATSSNIRRLLKDNGMIPAIKYVRSVTSFGLREAKDFVDQLVADESLPVWGRN